MTLYGPESRCGRRLRWWELWFGRKIGVCFGRMR